MENYQKALELSGVSANSFGTASEKYSIYLDSMEAKINELKASFADFSDTVTNADFAGGAVEGLTALTKALTTVIDKVGFLPTALGIAGGVIFRNGFGLTQNDGLYIWAIHSKEAA